MIRHYHSEENDVLICEFMKYEFDSNSGKYKLPLKIVPFIDSEDFGDYQHVLGFKDTFYIWNAKFHTSFDWLMPVTEKCFKSSGVGIRITYDIEEQYDIVMSFIKSYMK